MFYVQICKESLKDMKEHSAAQRMERDKDLPQRSQSNAASLISIGADISPSSSQFFEVIILFYIFPYSSLIIREESISLHGTSVKQ